MSFEPLIIQKWIYDTLSTDNTLAALLSGQKAPYYQQGIYNQIAPEKDPVSGKMPQLPYIVYRRDGSDGADDIALCGLKFISFPAFAITVWDNNNGSLAYKRIADIANRIDTLITGQKDVDGNVTFFAQRTDTDQPFEVQTDGRVDYGLTITYKFNTI